MLESKETNDLPEEEELEEETSGEMSISKRELRRRLGTSKKARETKVQRQRRLLLEKVKRRQKENEKQQRIQQNEIYRLKTLKKQVDAETRRVDEERQKRLAQEDHHNKYETKRIGRLRYEEPELDLKLSSELTSSLRTLKPEGNILTDRYKSLQKRNLIEPRVRARYFILLLFFCRIRAEGLFLKIRFDGLHDGNHNLI